MPCCVRVSVKSLQPRSPKKRFHRVAPTMSSIDLFGVPLMMGLAVLGAIPCVGGEREVNLLHRCVHDLRGYFREIKSVRPQDLQQILNRLPGLPFRKGLSKLKFGRVYKLSLARRVLDTKNENISDESRRGGLDR